MVGQNNFKKHNTFNKIKEQCRTSGHISKQTTYESNESQSLSNKFNQKPNKLNIIVVRRRKNNNKTVEESQNEAKRGRREIIKIAVINVKFPNNYKTDLSF